MGAPVTWPFSDRAAWSPEQHIAEERSGRISGATVTRGRSLAHSAVWACQCLRADLISTMPLDVFRRVATDAGPVQVEVPKPPVLVAPGGSPHGRPVRLMEWLWASQFDLDGLGNSIGVITKKDAAGLPVAIELVSTEQVVVRTVKGKLTYRIAGTTHLVEDVWHERQYALAGSPVGLSPIAHAAMSITGYLSAQQFAKDWFTNSTMPGGHLKNTDRKLDKREARRVKADFKASVAAGDVWVSGKDWEYDMLAAKASESQFLEQQRFSVADVCRFLGVPGDLIGAESGGASITYANISQRNLQLLIMNLGPAITRREEALSADLLPAPRFVKLNSDALLRMDPAAREDLLLKQVAGRTRAPSEARALANLEPFTDEQIAEMQRLGFLSAPALTLVNPTTPGGTP